MHHAYLDLFEQPLDVALTQEGGLFAQHGRKQPPQRPDQLIPILGRPGNRLEVVEREHDRQLLQEQMNRVHVWYAAHKHTHDQGENDNKRRAEHRRDATDE